MVDPVQPPNAITGTPAVNSPGIVNLGRVELLLLPERLNNLSRPVTVSGLITGQAESFEAGEAPVIE